MSRVDPAKALGDEQLDFLAEQLLAPVAEQLRGLVVGQSDLAVSADPTIASGTNSKNCSNAEPVSSGSTSRVPPCISHPL